MKCLLVLTGLLTAAVLLGAAAESATATYADHDKVAKGGAIATTPEYTVSVLRRTAAGARNRSRSACLCAIEAGRDWLRVPDC